MNDKGPKLLLRSALALACVPGFSGHVRAQHSEVPAPDTDVPTLERVEALRPEQEALDLYRFENPIVVEPNRFDEVYDPGPSPEEVTMKHGGYINYGIQLGVAKTLQVIKKVTGMRDDIQPATARPPPLSDEQMRRAATMCGTDATACPEGSRAK